jgi:hypothetical protein
MLFFFFCDNNIQKGVVTHFSLFSRTDDQKGRRQKMFTIDKENERNSYEVDGRKKDTSKCGDCHRIHILRLSADVCTSQKGVVEQSFSTRFISFTYVHSLSSYFARAYTNDERRRKF